MTQEEENLFVFYAALNCAKLVPTNETYFLCIPMRKNARKESFCSTEIRAQRSMRISRWRRWINIRKGRCKTTSVLLSPYPFALACVWQYKSIWSSSYQGCCWTDPPRYEEGKKSGGEEISWSIDINDDGSSFPFFLTTCFVIGQGRPGQTNPQTG